jgi:hypothetical protein
MPSDRSQHIEQSCRLIERLERLSADSYWAHQASGVRGALLRSVEQQSRQSETDSNQHNSNKMGLDELLLRGYFILEQAARELERRV